MWANHMKFVTFHLEQMTHLVLNSAAIEKSPVPLVRLKSLEVSNAMPKKHQNFG